jgi:hypothetical protein
VVSLLLARLMAHPTCRLCFAESGKREPHRAGGGTVRGRHGLCDGEAGAARALAAHTAVGARWPSPSRARAAAHQRAQGLNCCFLSATSPHPGRHGRWHWQRSSARGGGSGTRTGHPHRRVGASWLPESVALRGCPAFCWKEPFRTLSMSQGLCCFRSQQSPKCGHEPTIWVCPAAPPSSPPRAAS